MPKPFTRDELVVLAHLVNHHHTQLPSPTLAIAKTTGIPQDRVVAALDSLAQAGLVTGQPNMGSTKQSFYYCKDVVRAAQLLQKTAPGLLKKKP